MPDAFDIGALLTLEKCAEEDAWKRRGLVAGAGLGAAALTAGAIALARPGLRRNISAYLRGIGRGGARGLERSNALPRSARRQAQQLADHLRAQGLDPAKARIAIAGTGGTGKSTLARGLAAELGMKTKFLDDVAHAPQGRDFTRYFRRNPVPRGYIAEQTHLLNQVDPNKFDAIIRVHRPMDTIRRQILGRGRGAAQLEIYDYDRLHESIRTAFNATSGKVHHVGQFVDVKTKPRGGFQAAKKLREEIAARGLVVPPHASREDLVYMAAHGHMPFGKSVVPYVRKTRIAGAAGLVASGGGAGAIGAHEAMKRVGGPDGQKR